MLSFKSIAGFLKKVGGTREDHSKEGHQRGGADGSHAGAGSSGSASAFPAGSPATGGAGDSAHHRSYIGNSRTASTGSAGAVVGSHHGDAAYDSHLSDFPTSGMPSTFGDNVMFASSHILRGLPPNTSMQDVLLHIRCVVQERSEQLQQEEREEQERSSTLWQRGFSDGSIAAGENATAAGAQRRRSASFTSVAATNGAEARAAPCESAGPAASLKGKAEKGVARVAREHVQKLQKMRAEMIDALDLCLQEVPEDPRTWGSSSASVSEDERARNGRAGADAHKHQERSGGTPDAAADNNGDALLEGMRTESELVVSQQESSTAATVVGAAEPSAVIAQEPLAPADFGHYEWRRLLMDIINALVRIDRALLHDARLRALERLIPSTTGSHGNAGPEFRWENLSQALLTPAVLGSPFSAADAAATGSRRSQLPLTPTRGPQRHPPHGDSASLNSPLPSRNADTAALAGIATPRERAVTPVSTNPAARAGSSSSPFAKAKRVLADSGVVSPEPPTDLVITKEDKKMLEELLTIACSLASWAIVKAILRHHLHVLEQRQSRGSFTPLTKAGTTATASVRLSGDIPASATNMETSGAGNANTTGRPPLAPPAPPPPAAMNDAACSSDAAEGGAGAAETAATDDDQSKTANHISAMDDVDAIPYIDWAAVVQELAEWIGEQHFVAIAECILCASFLRDDGREMVLCMLQTPKPRRLLTNIHRHADKLRRADVDSLLSCSSPPRVVTAATVPAGSPTAATTAFSGSAPGATSSTLTSSGSPSASSSIGAAAAAPPAGTSANTAQTAAAMGATSFLPVAKVAAAGPSLTPNTIRAMLEDPTLVMDDLVARLEMVYRKAVANTWASYLEDAIEADVQQLSIAADNAVDAAGTPAAGDADTSPASTPTTHLMAAGDEVLKQSTGNVASPPALPLLQKVHITDTKTLCRLATAFFFGSDAWSENKRERRFALLFRSMRGRMERYSESAATRRHLRRGTICAASMTHTVASVAAASSLDSHPLVELAMAGAAAATTAPSSRGASQSQSLTIPPQMSASAAPVSSASAGLTPPKFSVEDTSARPSPSGGCPSAASNAAGVSTPALANRGGAPSSQWVAQQLLSSNASTAAISAHSTPLTASLLVSRDGTNDIEGTVSGAGGPINGSGLFTVGHTDRTTTWTPFAFAMTSSEPMTPPPELHHQSSSTTNQRGAEDGHQETGEDNVGRRAMESSALSIPTVTLQEPPTLAQPATSKAGDSALESLVLERIVNMSWSAALHKRGEQCLTAKPPRLEEAEQDALEERLVANAFGEFRARQRAIVSLINARLASGKSVEALTNAQKHFKFEKKDWTSHNQTIFSAMRYLQSMVFLVRAQAACRVYGAVIETVQFVLPQATLCEQMLQVLAPRPRGDYILRFGDCRSKLLRSYVYLLKEGWLAHAAFNDLAKAEKYFMKCAQVMQMLRRRMRETELFAAYMERGAQLMKLKEYKQSVELFRCAVNIAKKSLQAADAAAAAAAAASACGDSSVFSPNASVGPAGPSPGSPITNIENAVSAAAAGLAAKVPPAVLQQQFHRNLHLRAAGSGSLTTAEEHIPGVTDAIEDDLELVWRVAESERMLALSYVTQAEHEVNVRERREELSNAVSSAYSSQRSLQRWQRKGGTPKRLLTAVPCSLIVICKGLLLLNQPRKAALLLEPLIENKPNSPLLYARCLAEFDGDRALRAVTLVDQLLQESDAWICTIRTELRHALENVSVKDKKVPDSLNSPRTAPSVEVLRLTSAVSPRGAVGHGPNSEDGEDGQSYGRQGYGAGAETTASASIAATTVGKCTARTIEVPTLQMPTSHSSTGSPSPLDDDRHSPGWNSPEEAPLRPRRSTTVGTAGTASTTAVESASVHDEPSPGGGGSGGGAGGAAMDDDDRSRRSTSIQLSATGGNPSGADLFSLVNSVNAGISSNTAMPTAHSNHSPISTAPHLPQLPAIRVHTESSSECMTALFSLREAKSHIRKALRGIFIVSGDAYSLIKNWEEALKVYSHALVITMSEVEAASAAAQSRRRVSHSTPQAHFSSQQSSTSPVAADDGASLSAPHDAYETFGNNVRGDVSTSLQAWGPVVPLDEEFFLWDEEDVLMSDNLINRELTASTAARDLRAVVADEERMDSRACESVVLSKLANVYRALEKPATAIHYHTLVMEYANECHDKLLAYNSMLSLARLYTAANMSDKARDAWAKVSELAKEYEDKEVSRETMRNIVAAQEAAGMYMDVVKTAEELEKLATGEEGEDAARDSRFALEALANANLQLGQFDACIAALDSREKVQEKSVEWSGALLSMRAKARMGLNKSAEAIKVMQSWATKARNLANWVELGKANSALSAAYASENHNMQARCHHEATLNAFALAETLDEECRHIALESARWLVHYAYLNDTTVQIDPALTYTGGGLTSDSEASGCDFHYADSGLCNISGDLGVMLAREEELRRTSSMLGENCKFGFNDDDDDFGGGGGGGLLSNQSMFGVRPPEPSLADAPSPKGHSMSEKEEQRDNYAAAHGEEDDGEGAAAATEDDTPSMASSFVSSFLAPKDSGMATQPPSLASSVNISMRGSLTHLDAALGGGNDHSEGSSSAGQSDGGDNEAGEDVEDEAPRSMDVEHVAEHQQDPKLPISVEGEEAGDLVNLKKSAPKPSAATPTPTVITAAAKPTVNTATVAGSGSTVGKSASSTYVPPPTSLANVSICSRPAAAAAGTDVLELPVDASHSASEHATLSGPSTTSSPLMSSSPRGAAFQGGPAATASGGDDDGAHERKPSTVRTTYFRGAIEMIETAAQLLLVPRSVRHIVIPYSPAEAVDFALIAHPQSLFVFYFAEYTTAYGAQCDVVVRPPHAAGFMKLRAQISLQEYHNKDAMSALLASTSAEFSITGEHGNAAETSGAASSSTHPFGTAMARAATGSVAASPPLTHSTPEVLRAALEEETSTCLRNLYADAWQPIADRMRREHVNYQDVEELIIMPDVSLMHLPFAGFLPSPNYGDEEAPLGEQFTLIVTPCLTHFVHYGMAHQPQRSRNTSGALDPAAKKYIFLPYDGSLGAGSAAPSPQLAMPSFALCATSSSSTRPQQQTKTGTGTAANSATSALTATVGSAASKASVHNAVAPPVSSAHSLADSLPTGHPLATFSTIGNMSVRSNPVPADPTSATPSSAPQLSERPDTFDDLLRTWRVHRGCTRKELIQAFTDVRTRALMFLAPVDQGSIRVADGVVTIQDLTQNLQQVRVQQPAANVTNLPSNATSLATSGSPGATATAIPPNTSGAPPALPLPPLCSHVDLLILTANRSQYPTVSDAGASAKLCMELGVHRVLRLNILHGLLPNDEHHAFIALYLANLKKVMRWMLKNPYAVALRTTMAEARRLGMSSNTWGAFTLVGVP
ncbi:conserved hypothetical protein [Leishmania mexicana MHOM/GT/2001/U1103]|uniref:Uncharacterized protein n=1 Tax=Leishmania mexicana (strain MHOM/GT/2001/U1103) TaxID=929439 RepID=E9B3Y5_LEIMU|nr:conserved hypothetical protein [Leishmania mexicana MHOM/GT/2001/U1103]CBZ29952.1 conserved hypothetical protein [Leishmania mexicana MHOM/GT/2001/U1103]